MGVLTSLTHVTYLTILFAVSGLLIVLKSSNPSLPPPKILPADTHCYLFSLLLPLLSRTYLLPKLSYFVPPTSTSYESSILSAPSSLPTYLFVLVFGGACIYGIPVLVD